MVNKFNFQFTILLHWEKTVLLIHSPTPSLFKYQWSYFTHTHSKPSQKYSLNKLLPFTSQNTLALILHLQKKKEKIYSGPEDHEDVCSSRVWICPENVSTEEQKQEGKKMIKKSWWSKAKNSVTLKIYEASETSGFLLWCHVLPINQEKPKNPDADLVRVSGYMEKSNQLVMFCFLYNDKGTASLRGSKNSKKWKCLPSPSSSRQRKSQNNAHAKHG